KIDRQRTQRHSDTDGPAFQMFDSRRNLLFGKIGADNFSEGARLLDRKFELLLADREDVTSGDQFGKRQIRQRAADEDEMAALWKLAHQLAQPPFRLRRGRKEMEVVHHIQRVAGEMLAQIRSDIGSTFVR